MERFQEPQIKGNWAPEEKKEVEMNIAGIDARASSSVGSSFKAEMVKLEQAIHVVPKNSRLSLLHYTVLFYMVLLAGPLIGFQLQSNTTLNLVQSSVEVMSKSIFRLVRITDLTQYTRILWEADIGLLEADRYESLGYNTSIRDTAITQLYKVVDELNQRNNDIRAFVYKLDSNLQDSLYKDRIPVYEMNSSGIIISR